MSPANHLARLRAASCRADRIPSLLALLLRAAAAFTR